MSECISIDPDICNGRPVIRGTRITVETVLEFLAAGDSMEEVLEEYPGLTRSDFEFLLKTQKLVNVHVDRLESVG